MRKWLRTSLLLVALASAAGVAWFSWWAPRHGDVWLDRQVARRLQRVINSASVPGYRFTYHSLKADARSGSLLLTGAELGFDPALLDSLRKGTYQYLFAVKADTIALHGLSFRRLLLHGEFHVAAIVLAAPDLHYLTGPKRVDLVDPFKRLAGEQRGLVTLLKADTIIVHQAGAVVRDLGEQLPVLDIAGLDLAVLQARISTKGTRSGVRLSVGGAELRVDSLNTSLPNGSHLHIGAISLSRASRTGHIAGLRLSPPPQDTLHRWRKSLTTLTMESIALTGVDLDRSIADEALWVGRMAVHGMHVLVTLDKTRPEAARSPVLLPPAALAALPFSIRLDTLSVLGANVHYRERHEVTRRWGEVDFTHLHAEFLHITNHPAARVKGERITGTVEGALFDSASVAVRYAADLDTSGRFLVVATVSDLPLTHLNRAVQPLMRMQIGSGMLHRLALRMDGNDVRARGNLSLHYSDLLLRVEPGTPSAVRHSMFGSVMDAMLSQAYGGPLDAEGGRDFTVQRERDRSIFTYCWHATREGLVRNLVPEAKDRMRTMLRTDAEQRREERALRKARKGKVR